MDVRCARCGTPMETGEELREDGRAVTHRVCSSCVEEAACGDQRARAEVLEILGMPTLLLDRAERTIAANSAAHAALGSIESRISGMSVGDALGCAYARGGGRCGTSRCCEACAVHCALQHTRVTRHPLEHVIAHQILRLPEGERPMRIMLSTEALGSYVLLQIEEMCADRRRLSITAEQLPRGYTVLESAAAALLMNLNIR